jgi:hypothetical protein
MIPMKTATMAVWFIMGAVCATFAIMMLQDMRAHAYVGPMQPGPRLVIAGEHSVILSPRYTAVVKGPVKLSPTPLRAAAFKWRDQVICDGYESLTIESWRSRGHRAEERGPQFRLGGRTFARTARGSETLLTARGTEFSVTLVIDHSKHAPPAGWLEERVSALEPR